MTKSVQEVDGEISDEELQELVLEAQREALAKLLLKNRITHQGNPFQNGFFG